MGTTKVSYSLINGAPGNPLDFGADPTGSTDSTSALNAWLAAGGGYLPRGTYLVSGAITLSNNCVIEGEGKGISIITSNSTTADVVVAPESCSNYHLKNFTVTRSVAPSGTPVGVNIGKNATGYLEGVYSINHHYGFKLGPTSRSLANDCEAAYNYGDGFYFLSTADSPYLQWYMTRPVSQLNDGNGFHFYSTYIGSTPTYCTGPTFINSGTFANTGCGYLFEGDANTYLTDMVFDCCFSSSDGYHGFSIENLGANNQFVNVFSELAGQTFTGRTYTTAKSNAGAGFAIVGTAAYAESAIRLSGIFFKNSYQGIAVADSVNAGTIMLDSCQCIDNSVAVANFYDGVFIGTNLSSRITISNLVSKNMTSPPGAGQRWGFNTNSAAVTWWVGGSCLQNITGQIYPASGSFGALLGVGTT